jgi:hypothetical protein
VKRRLQDTAVWVRGQTVTNFESSCHIEHAKLNRAGTALVTVTLGVIRDGVCGVSCTNIIHIVQTRYICLIKTLYAFRLILLYNLYRDDI